MARLFKRNDTWWLDYSDHRSDRVRRPGSTDKSVAQHLLGEAIRNSEKLRAGVIAADPREGKRPIVQHVDDYMAEMERRGRDEMYRYTVRKRLDKAIKAAKWDRLTDCTPKSITIYLAGLSALAPKTRNDYRADLAAWFAWAVQAGRMEANPCAAVSKTTVKTEKKRRALSLSECRALLESAPKRRRLVYLFLMLTGARRAEAAQLRWGDLRLDGLSPRVDFRSSTTKSGKPESVPLVGELAEALRVAREALVDVADDAPVFRAIPMIGTFRKDLAAAKIDRMDERGREVVLHSLRHSLATMLAGSNVPMAVAQRVMRHRDIRLTAETYTDEALLPMAAAMKSLPAMDVNMTAPVMLRATGTDGKCVPDFVPFARHKVAQAGNGVRVSTSASAAQVSIGARVGTLGHTRTLGGKVGDLGFEPRLSESESLVLPLH